MMLGRSVRPTEATRLFPKQGRIAPLTVDNDKKDEERSYFVDYVRPCVAEFFSSAMFVFVSSMAVLTGTSTVIALAHGFTIAVLVANFGAISGGHVNPAVTLGVCLSGGLGPLSAVLYVLSQLTGSILGASFCRGSLSYMPVSDSSNQTQFELIAGGIFTLPPGVSDPVALLAETVLTTLLVTTVLLTQIDTGGRNQVHPIGIGFAVLVGTLAGFKLTGGTMNPALRFGPVVVMSDIDNVWDHHWVFWLGPLGGAAIAALLYRQDGYIM